MKFKLLEKEGYHYGDLDIAKKSELGIMAGRGTGHFGSGFYLIGKYDPENAYNYSKRAHWVVDLDSYNLFKPENNREGYELHDALKVMNNTPLSATIKVSVSEYQPYIEQIDELMNDQYNFLDNLADIEYMGTDDIMRVNNLMKDYQNGKLNSDTSTQIKEYNQNLIDQLKDIYSHFNLKFPEEDVQEAVYWESNFDIEKDFKEIINKHNEQAGKFRQALIDLYFLVGLPNNISKEQIEQICKEAIEKTTSYKFDTKEDSTSTLIMKALGYDGVDVTHLDKDGGGLRGLDNFTYGSVIYDLKPGTYKKIKDKTQ